MQVHQFKQLIWETSCELALATKVSNSINFYFVGECVVFDNLRILHGRKGFDLKENGERTVQGGYVDWDEVRSKINILKLVLGDNWSRCTWNIL